MVKIAYVDVSCVDDRIYGRLYDLADAQRQSRAQRYLRFEDKVRCVTAGAILRHAVRDRLGIESYGIDTDVNGKPHIKDAPGFHFNLSHSGKWVVIAYGDSPVGIDVEKINPHAAVEKIASRFYAPDERSYVQGCPERFFEIWTAKESYIKYLGKGLRMGLDSFSVLSAKDVRFTPIRIDPAYSMTLCAAQAPDTIEQLTAQLLTQL